MCCGFRRTSAMAAPTTRPSGARSRTARGSSRWSTTTWSSAPAGSSRCSAQPQSNPRRGSSAAPCSSAGRSGSTQQASPSTPSAEPAIATSTCRSRSWTVPTAPSKESPAALPSCARRRWRRSASSIPPTSPTTRTSISRCARGDRASPAGMCAARSPGIASRRLSALIPRGSAICSASATCAPWRCTSRSSRRPRWFR